MSLYAILKSYSDESAPQDSNSMSIGSYHPKSSSHRPKVSLRLWHTTDTLCGTFEVDDNYIVVTQQEYNSDVWRDSCVELFLSPPEIEGYFNFEFSGGGAFRIFHIIDHRRVGALFQDYRAIPQLLGKMVRVTSTLPSYVFPSQNSPQKWQLDFSIPLDFFQTFHKNIAFKGLWQGNAFKCAGDSSHPHWASWIPIGEELNFHQPHIFGTLCFEN